MKNSYSSARSAVLTAFFAALICISAWISVPSAVPFTMQTFTVCLCGALLGAKRGAAAVLVYIFLGAIGLPVFSGFRSGAAVIFGATGGYTLGFIPLAAITGFFGTRFGRKMHIMLPAMLLGICVCYLLGTLWYTAIYLSSEKSLLSVIGTCVLPFLIPDTVKLFLAAVCAKKAEKFIK